MTNLVERLRRVSGWFFDTGHTGYELETVDEAANRIEKLEKALRIAAGYISTFPPHTDQHPEDVYNWILMQLETE